MDAVAHGDHDFFEGEGGGRRGGCGRSLGGTGCEREGESEESATHGSKNNYSEFGLKGRRATDYSTATDFSRTTKVRSSRRGMPNRVSP
jgi:hypothetical protein